MNEELKPARVRFAPSPTGSLHLGSLRTALFDWLYARHTGGQFILRIEDTDQKRYDPNSLEDLMRGLLWLGLQWDEGPDIGGPYGPYVQSERRETYHGYAEQLIESGHAYRCYCSPEELEEMRTEQRAQGRAQGYDRRCRNLTETERAAFESEGRSHVVRFAAPLTGVTVVHDLIRGDIEVENSSILDPVILKGDGMPTYHLAVVIDDYLMKSTHILRGQEWISSAPLHKLLYDAFGWPIPHFVHMSVILDPSGKGKMSKRKKVVAGKEYLAQVSEFIEAGYLPEALFNFLANIGWNYDPEQEVFTREQAIERFELADITPAPAVLPYAKLDWLNGVYIREMDPAELQQRLVPFLARQLGLDEEMLGESERLANLVPLIQERIKVLTEAADKVDWAFMEADQITYPDPSLLIGKNLDAVQSLEVLRQGRDILVGVPEFSAPELESAFREAAADMLIKVGSFLGPFRVALTGKTVSPPLFESMEVLGRAETVARVKNALAALHDYAKQTVN
jgi:glutamyl-tRNA synthetase